MTPDQSKALRGKMPDNLVSKFPANAGANANKEYAGHAAVTDRLLEVDPEWTWKFLGDGTPVFDDVGGIWIELTVCGVTRIGYGFPERLKGGNAVKEAIGDAIRNAAMRFGVGLEFWFKGDLFADPDKGQELLSEAQLQELSTALSLVANKPGALKYLKSKLGTDEIDKLTESQFGSAMELIGSVPKLTDIMSAQAKDVFYKQIMEAKFVPVEILKALNFSDDSLTYAQKSEMTDYIKILKKQKA
jgi:hypothetical protein